MPREYRPKASRRNTRRGAPGWLWLMAGLVLGLFVAFLIYLKDNYSDLTLISRPAPVEKRTPAPRPAPKKPVPPPPRYDFYTLLPEMEVVVPEQAPDPKSETGVAPVTAPGIYVLQAGSFRKYEQADRLKANLALLGIQAEIQRVTIDSDQTWHRVRIGPYNNLNELNQIRERLRQNDINTILLELKG